MFGDEEWALLERAIVHARDSAFLTTGDKTSEPVKLWERLLKKVRQGRVDEYHERRS